VLLEPRHATIKDGSPTVGGGSVWCVGFCGQIMCFQDREDKGISPSKQIIFVGDMEVNLANQRSVRVAGNPSGIPNCFDVDITNLDNPV
jgi:hypothetical protein